MNSYVNVTIMKTLSSIALLIFSVSFLMSCAAPNNDNLERRMAKQEAVFDNMQDRHEIRSNSLDRRLNTMSDKADARYEKSFDRLMNKE